MRIMDKMTKSRDIVVANIERRMQLDPDLDSEPKLAKKAGMSQSTLHRILKDGADFTTEKLDGLARALKCTASELLLPHQAAPIAREPQAPYEIRPKNPTMEKIRKRLEHTDELGLAIALQAIDNAFNTRELVSQPGSRPGRKRSR